MLSSKYLSLFLSLTALLALWYFSASCLGYLVRAGYGQLEILWERKPIEEIIQNPNTESAIREKLQHVLTVRDFAGTELGLKASASYTTYSQINRPMAAWNVSAAEELALKPKTWWFPIVGTVPYLGFFRRELAEELGAELRSEGWDVVIRGVPAYSTLGWFDDPLLSSQMKYSRWYLARLVIHESAHAAIWFPGDVNFNESFASFVEQEGSLQFYKKNVDEKTFQRRLLISREQQIIAAIFRRYAKKLDSLYQSSLTDTEKRKQKKQLIQTMKTEFQDNKEGITVLNVNNYSQKEYNNANFLSYLRYDSGQDFFRSRFEKQDRNWGLFLKDMRQLSGLSATERQALLHANTP